MKLSESRSGVSEKAKSTGISLFDRAVGRDSRPTWGNRIYKDFNDLNYDVNVDRFAHINRFKKVVPSRGIKKRKSSQRHNSPGKVRGFEAVNTPRLNKSCFNPESIEIGEFPSPTSKNHLNLCPYQYSNTIEGRMVGRSNHHLSFTKNRTNRSVNLNPIYYDRHNDIDYSVSRTIDHRRAVSHQHPFNSYTQRRVFEPKEELDKIFDTDQSRKVGSPSRIRQSVRPFEKVVERVEPKAKESESLTYDVAPGLDRLLKTPPKYSIDKRERDIKFKRQVIDDKRGCYR